MVSCPWYIQIQKLIKNLIVLSFFKNINRKLELGNPSRLLVLLLRAQQCDKLDAF